MSIENTLKERSGSKCELCSSEAALSVYEVPPKEASSDKCILLCSTCKSQVEDTSSIDVNHWRCLNDSMWSEHPVVQVMAYRMLKIMADEGWAQELAEQMYMEDTTMTWALKGLVDLNKVPTRDSNGTILQAGDTVHLIKDLVVKGAGFTAKRGTIVRNISLTDNPEHIEGRADGVKVVLVSAYLKKS